MAKVRATKVTNNPDDIQGIVDDAVKKLGGSPIDFKTSVSESDFYDVPTPQERRAMQYKDDETRKAMTRYEKLLDDAFKDKAENSSVVELKAMASDTALAEYVNQVAKREDQKLADAKLAAKLAGEAYSDLTKINKARIAWIHFILENRGKA